MTSIFLHRITARLTIETRLDPLALTPSAFERTFTWGVSKVVSKLGMSQLPRAFTHLVRLGYRAEANRVLERASEFLREQRGSLGTPPQSHILRWLEHTLYIQHESDPTGFASEAGFTLLGADIHRVEQAISTGTAMLRSWLEGHKPHWNTVLVSAPPESLLSANSAPSVLSMVTLLSQSTDSFAVVPDYLLGRLSLGPDARILSHHTVGKLGNGLHFKEADIPPYMVVDPQGFGGWAQIASFSLEDLPPEPSEERAIELCNEFSRNAKGRNWSKYPQPPIEPEPPATPTTVFLALQKPGDMTERLRRWSPGRLVLTLWILAVIRGWMVEVKFHPLGSRLSTRLLCQVLSWSNNLKVTDASVHALIPRASAVFTVNSGVGSEALMYLKPVYTFGACDYAPGSHEVSSVQQLWNLTRNLKPPVNVGKLARYAVHYRHSLLCDYESEDQLNEKIRLMLKS